MNIPGFTAEASLHETSEPFEFNLAWVGSVAGQEVVPQALPPPAASQITLFSPFECTYGPCIPEIYCDSMGCHRTGGHAQRCCYYYGNLLGCNRVEC